MKRFKAGVTYSTRSADDHECVYKYKCVATTENSIWIETTTDGVKQVKIHIDSMGDEFAYPDDLYFMCPIIRAERRDQ